MVKGTAQEKIYCPIEVTTSIRILLCWKERKQRSPQTVPRLSIPNEWTVKNGYPLPLVSDLMNKIKGAKYFTKLDLPWGYNNVRIKKGDEWKAAFITNRGLFEPRVMFFGLCNSPSTFQTMMDSYFQEMINEGWLVIYMDDMLLYADTKEELRERTK